MAIDDDSINFDWVDCNLSSILILIDYRVWFCWNTIGNELNWIAIDDDWINLIELIVNSVWLVMILFDQVDCVGVGELSSMNSTLFRWSRQLECDSQRNSIQLKSIKSMHFAAI